jgi:cell division protein FtsB
MAHKRKGKGKMSMLRGLRISTFIFSMGLVYFAVHFFVGQQGLLSWRSYVQRADELSLERHQLTARQQVLAARIARLQPGQVDRDYVEERAFSQLGLVSANDVAIVLAKPAVAATPE